MKNLVRKSGMSKWMLMVSMAVTLFAAGCGNQNNEAGGAVNANNAGNNQSTAATLSADVPVPPSSVKERGKLRVGVKVDYPPLGYLDENGKNAGYEIGVVKKIAEYAFGDANAVEFVPVNATNRIPYLDSNKIDFIAATLGVTEERKQQLDFSTNFFDGGVVTVVKKDSGITTIPDLAGKTVIVIKGSTGSTYLDENVPTAKQIKIESNADAFRALKDGRADAMFHDAVLMSEFVKTSTDYTIVGEQVAFAPMALGVRKNEADMLDFVNGALEQMRKEDYFKSLIEEYMPQAGDLDPMQMIPRP
ncbi:MULTISPECIES: transporter substrate-binding domain-containing protein [unclassified Paenibacillus]|uniref:transporter substrate-binding domain-containing protein n=1 Tax=unclassified Paenibacillus TaxID=185978 RepID=UPI002405EFEC|nr:MULTISPECIES: transporter substrate-binding domain-containing protein [unclassified Paenibacillus]MDF9839491.1 polar amino acid transport system substrate-binding protein [Paenibacillus sp. PastF-2]MDF9846072.1 polar amino acid transport system substrate-binding protein [Paenibacillus sp. PastM-2]MDF9852645.1 polar amino acid transport system substrate-binding protein [Paenibacillus sp. PastF-1]MDH6477624.1 polar amino acid transport system substrate-binding protein [Paenibacillus sp. PastH-